MCRVSETRDQRELIREFRDTLYAKFPVLERHKNRGSTPGDKVSDPVAKCLCWWNDIVNDLYNDDALWFWAAKASHRFMEWRGKGIIDPVLHCLFTMGLFNWMAPK